MSSQWIIRGAILVVPMAVSYLVEKFIEPKLGANNKRKKHKCFVCKQYGNLDSFVEMECGHYKHEKCPNTCPCVLFEIVDKCVICKQKDVLGVLGKMKCGHMKHKYCPDNCVCQNGKQN